ncbi:MAG TPA: glyceraldehyde 3-phosphate dehydrogenase NAD-binding domain-containing protein [Solirubrobacteraceae bacterium]
MRIGLNGFGRIGRAVLRASRHFSGLRVVHVNDTQPDRENLRYLLAHDSVYGPYPGTVERVADDLWLIEGTPVHLSSKEAIGDVDWIDHGVDVVVDAAGTHPDRDGFERVIERGVGSVIVTAPHDAETDATVIWGVNQNAYRPAQHTVVSASSCDGNALAPLLSVLDESYGCASGSVTTLHPWLNYQPVLDGPCARGGMPPGYLGDYDMGRSAASNVIGKRTSALGAVASVLPALAPRFTALSFRIPTAIVCVAHVTANLASDADPDALNALFARLANDPDAGLGFNTEPLVSSDFSGTLRAGVVDGRFTGVVGGRTATVTVWYDNEHGYASNVVRLAALMGAAREDWPPRPLTSQRTPA